MRRFLTMALLAYLLVAFGFTALILLNGSEQGGIVAIAEADAGVIVALCTLGIVVTGTLGLRMLIDSKQRRDLERLVREPRKKSDTMNQQSRPE